MKIPATIKKHAAKWLLNKYTPNIVAAAICLQRCEALRADTSFPNILETQPNIAK